MKQKLLFIFAFVVLIAASINLQAQNCTVTYKQNAGLLKDVVLINPIKMNPNVVHDFVKVSVDPALKDLHKTIAIYDVLGRLMTIEIFEGTEKQMFLQNLSHGLYFVKIDSPEISIVSKFEIN